MSIIPKVHPACVLWLASFPGLPHGISLSVLASLARLCYNQSFLHSVHVCKSVSHVCYYSYSVSNTSVAWWWGTACLVRIATTGYTGNYRYGNPVRLQIKYALFMKLPVTVTWPRACREWWWRREDVRGTIGWSSTPHVYWKTSWWGLYLGYRVWANVKILMCTVLLKILAKLLAVLSESQSPKNVADFKFGDLVLDNV